MKTPLLLDFGSVSTLIEPLRAASPRSITPPFQNDGSKVAMRLFGRSDQDLLVFGRTHFSAMEGNAYFPNPSPSQANFGAMLDAFEDDCAEVLKLKSLLSAAVAQKNARRKALTDQLDRRASYVQSICYGNRQVITSSSLGVQRARHVVGNLPAPTGLQVVPGVASGEVTLTWNKVKHVLVYTLEYGVEGEEPIQMILSGRRKKRLTLTQLGANYVFRMAATGTLGQSNWSAPVSRIAS